MKNGRDYVRLGVGSSVDVFSKGFLEEREGPMRLLQKGCGGYWEKEVGVTKTN